MRTRFFFGMSLALALPLMDGEIARAADPTGAAPLVRQLGSPSASPIGTGRLARLAPADAYFGPFGMSPLSIRTTIGLLGRQYHYRTISDHDLLRKALLTEAALRKWRTAYPADPWLAPTFFHLEQLYQAVQSEEARKHATAILKDVIQNYPDTKEGHLSRARLAAGFPPLVPETPLVAPSATAAQASLVNSAPASNNSAGSGTSTASAASGTSIGPSTATGSAVQAATEPVPAASPSPK